MKLAYFTDKRSLESAYFLPNDEVWPFEISELFAG